MRDAVQGLFICYGITGMWVVGDFSPVLTGIVYLYKKAFENCIQVIKGYCPKSVKNVLFCYKHTILRSVRRFMPLIKMRDCQPLVCNE